MSQATQNTTQKPARRNRGFAHAAKLVETRIRDAGAQRGFAVARLLTHWGDIVGEDIAAMARPVAVRYGRHGLGATLTVLTTGAQAPMLEMEKQKIRERVNACYGYNAISRIHLTQTAPTGFAEGQAAFAPAPKKALAQDPKQIRRAASMVRDVGDDGLRAALEALGANILSRKKQNQDKKPRQ